MKRFLLSLAVGALFGGVLLAQTPDVTVKFGKNGWTPAFPTAVSDNESSHKDANNFVVKVTQVKSTSQGKDANYTDAIILTKSTGKVVLQALDRDISKMVFYSHKGASTSAVISVEGTGAGTAPTIALKTADVTTAYTLDFGSAPVESGKILTLKATSAANVQLSKVEIFLTGEEDQRQEANLSFTIEEFTANIGEEFTSPLVVNPNNIEGIKYSSSHPEVASVNESTGELSLVARGTTTITASFEGNDEYKADEASYTLTVKDPNAMDVTFDFINNDYGLTRSSSSYTVTGTLTASPVTIDLSKEDSSSGFRLWNDGLRVYKGTTYMSFAVPAGLMITDVNFECDAPSSTQIHKETSTGNYATDAATSYTGINNQIIKFKIVATDNKAIKTILVKYAKVPAVEKIKVDGLFADYGNGTEYRFPDVSSEVLYSEDEIEYYIPENKEYAEIALGSTPFWGFHGEVIDSVEWTLDSQSHDGVITKFKKDGLRNTPIECGFNTGNAGIGHFSVTLLENESIIELTNRKVDVVVYPHTSVHFPYTDEELANALNGTVLFLPKHDETNDGSYKYHYMVGGAAVEPEAAPRRVVSHEGYTEYNHDEGITLPQGTNTLSLVAEKNGVMSPEPATFQVKVSGPTGVNELSADAEAEYFDLSGRKLQGQPEKGLYIVRIGNKTRKVAL